MNDHMSAEEYRRTVINPATNEDIFGENEPVMQLTKAINAAMPQPTEHEIQNAILDRLRLVRRGFFWRENSGIMSAEHNGKKRMFRAGITGIADIMGVYQGFPVAIEVKRPGKKPSREQLAFKQRFEECGGIYVVCTDAAMVMGQLSEQVNSLFLLKGVK